MTADSLQQVLRRVYASSDYDWTQSPDPLQFLRDAFWGIVEWLRALSTNHPVAYWAILSAMVVVLVTVIVHLAYVIWQVVRPQDGGTMRARASAPVIHDVAWHLGEARRLAAARRYAEALSHRFVALLLELDRRHLIRFDPSKTPAEYVDEAALDDVQRGRLHGLVTSLYGHVFGGAPCAADDLEAFQQRATAIVRHGGQA